MLESKQKETGQKDTGQKGTGQNPQEEGEMPILIKKYSNRRLYDTTTSSTITCEDLFHYIKQGKPFTVFDTEEEKDVTKSILLQILVEKESKNEGLLSEQFLRNLIAFYGTNIGAVIPPYLDQSMDVFVSNQNHLREYFKDKFSSIFQTENTKTGPTKKKKD